jgi:hypothetical protein
MKRLFLIVLHSVPVHDKLNIVNSLLLLEVF